MFSVMGFHIEVINSVTKWGVFAIFIIEVTTALAAVDPKVIMGYESGELKRCKFSNVESCALLSVQDSPVYSLAVAGEFIYIGLKSGELRRCTQFRPSNCTTFHQKKSKINALAISGQSIFVASDDGITKCGLRKSDDCESFYESDTPVYSLLAFKGKVYAGTDSAVVRCTPDVSLDCTIITNTTSTVIALTASGKNIYLGLKDAAVEICELNSTLDCFPLFLTQSEIRDIDIIDNFIQASLDSGEIVHYDIDTDQQSTYSTGNYSTKVLSMSIVYRTTPVHRYYIGESSSCVWQFTSCPPYVVYYDVESRAALELHVKDGLIYNTNDELFDTDGSSTGHWRSGAIFVMDSAGKIFASNQHPIGLLHHSSLMSGKPAAAAGEIHANEGVIESISSCSGHYQPSIQLTKQVKSSLKKQGYDRNITFIDCFRRKDLLIDLNFKKTDLYYKVKYEKYSRKMKNINKKNLQVPTSIIF